MGTAVVGMSAVHPQGISDRSLVIGVMGLGYVGLPLCHTFHKVGYSVIGFDTDKSKITALEVWYLPPTAVVTAVGRPLG
jgi:hypothetical protein